MKIGVAGCRLLGLVLACLLRLAMEVSLPLVELEADTVGEEEWVGDVPRGAVEPSVFELEQAAVAAGGVAVVVAEAEPSITCERICTVEAEALNICIISVGTPISISF